MSFDSSTNLEVTQPKHQEKSKISEHLINEVEHKCPTHDDDVIDEDNTPWTEISPNFGEGESMSESKRKNLAFAHDSKQFLAKHTENLTVKKILKEQASCPLVKRYQAILEWSEGDMVALIKHQKQSAENIRIQYLFNSAGILLKRHGKLKNLKEPKIICRSTNLAEDSLYRRKRAINRLLSEGRIVVPVSMRADVMFLWHGIPLTAHLSSSPWLMCTPNTLSLYRFRTKGRTQ